jgi:hypothetical protein
MRRQAMIMAALSALIAATGVCGADPPCTDQQPGWSPGRLGPTGGWFPYGGGLLRWWPAECFPRCGAPDDYCRKTLPCVCWPSYPSYYIWGPPEVCCPQTIADRPARRDTAQR